MTFCANLQFRHCEESLGYAQDRLRDAAIPGPDTWLSVRDDVKAGTQKKKKS
jgi:hypothetical protein